MKLKLIEDRRWMTWPSLHLSAAMAAVVAAGPALMSTWASMPDDLKAALPQGWARWIAMACLGLVALTHFVEFDHGTPMRGNNDAQ
jgi:hypothetical protein